jgi:hypothetical protein
MPVTSVIVPVLSTVCPLHASTNVKSAGSLYGCVGEVGCDSDTPGAASSAAPSPAITNTMRATGASPLLDWCPPSPRDDRNVPGMGARRKTAGAPTPRSLRGNAGASGRG